jgi:peptide/nickel transport system permease protein
MGLSLLGVSLPTFLIGILLILCSPCTWLAAQLRRGEWCARLLDAPAAHGDGWKHLMLPAVTLALFQLTLIMRLVRAEMLEVLRTDYIKFAARARPADRTVYFGHALKNTLVPVITITGLQLGA